MSLIDRIRYRLLWLDVLWVINVGRQSDGSYRFFIFHLVHARGRHIHDVMKELETFLVWQFGRWYFAIT